jgi:YD repeat-containing protein
MASIFTGNNLTILRSTWVAFFLIVACDDEKSPTPDAPKCNLLTETSEHISVEYTYNASGQLSTMKVVTDVSYLKLDANFEYNSAGQVTKITYNGNLHSTFEYSENNTVMTEKFFADNSNYSTVEHKFDNEGRRIRAGSPFTTEVYERYQYNSDGNLEKFFQGTMGTEYLHSEFTAWDDKRNAVPPFSFRSGSAPYATLVPFFNPYGHKNNPTAVTFRDINGTATHRTIAYEYNEHGYPTKIMHTSPNVPAVINQTYDCP